MICTVCKIEKPEDNFQKYFHSTQNKWRIRKQCTPCLYQRRRKDKEIHQETIIVQPVVPELQPEPINTKLKKCKICFEHKEDFEFYTAKGKVVGLICRKCQNKRDREERQEYLEENCGSEFVWSEVGKYNDEFQKNCTFNLMRTLGYLYDEKTGIWTKPGWKEIKDGEPFFPHIVKRKSKWSRLKEEDKLKIIELRDRGYTCDEIAIALEISDTTVYKYVKI